MSRFTPSQEVSEQFKDLSMAVQTRSQARRDAVSRSGEGGGMIQPASGPEGWRGKSRSHRSATGGTSDDESSDVSDETDSEMEEDTDDDDDDDHVVTSRRTSIKYIVDNELVQAHAKSGIRADLVVRYCWETDDNGANYAVLGLYEPVELSFGENVRQCSCQNSSPGSPCKHIFWLVDNIFDALPAKERPAPGTEVQKPWQRMGQALKKGAEQLPSLAKNRKWCLLDDNQNANSIAQERLPEMLSVFEPQSGLPLEETQDLYRDAYRKFIEALSARTRADPSLAESLGTAISLRLQAVHNFDKIAVEVTEAFRALDTFAAMGPTSLDFTPPGMDVDACATQLLRLIHRVEKGWRTFSPSLNAEQQEEVGSRAARALVKILENVASRNKNAYANSAWWSPSGSPQQTNLYAKLVNPYHQGPEDPFVLGTLLRIQATIPANILRTYEERLQAIRNHIGKNDAPVAFKDAFEELIRGISRKRSAPEGAERSGPRRRTP